jgi:ATP-binding cassette subfamily F protein 3
VVIGYFDQHLAGVDDDADVVDSIRPGHKQFHTQQRRDLLARFGITGETALQKVGRLSGGERCRTALARLAAADANFLVLDEPTNHLDLWARASLERALADFEGTVLFVSHDRYFLNRVADHVLVLEDGQVRAIDGNYEAYQTLLRQKTDGAANVSRGPGPGREKKATAAAPSTRSKKPLRHGGKPQAQAAKPQPQPAQSRPQPGGRPKRRFPFRKVADLEEEILHRESRIRELTEELAQEATYRDGNRVRDIKTSLAQEQDSLKALYEHWTEATELNW